MESEIIKNLSILTGLPLEKIKAIVLTSKDQFSKRKVTVGTKVRYFFIPSPNLKLLQLGLNRLYFDRVAVSNHAHGYVTGKSIKTNVLSHVGNMYFYKTDIVSFFPSITKGMVKKALYLLFTDLDEVDLEVILSLVCPFNSIQLGSSTSPVLSNLILIEFDKKLDQQLKDIDPLICYTRYSDDIVVSSKNILSEEVNNLVVNLLEEFGFRSNLKKTKFVANNNYVKITGLYLQSNGDISVGSNFKKRLKHCIHTYLNKNKNVDVQIIIGMLAFLKNIEPQYYQMISLKYSSDKSLMARLTHPAMTDTQIVDDLE